uniref:Uncharacterized protein n=1 Tax=Roseihalotalea indica TaxID=2867963 RepID=A0AA49JFX5_9BACT|nr:hypothetical protein K4G66_27795 [Tunicatimonas sp. TK19036]
MGTEEPNPNAVLDLVSEKRNQGLLVPRLSVSETEAITKNLSETDNGLLIFVEDKGRFYYWWDYNWHTLEPDGNTTSSEGSVGVEAPSLLEGHLWVGNETSQATSLNASSSGSILVGDGKTVASVTITGDLILQPDGTLTLKNTSVTTEKIADEAIIASKIANDAVTRSKIHSNVAGLGIRQAANGSLEVTNTGGGELLIGQGDSVVASGLSGDITLNADGSTKVTGLRGRSVSNNLPEEDQVLTWDGDEWTPQDVAFFSFGGSSERWYSGNNTPSFTYPSGADNGDFYYDTNDNRVYLKESGSWNLLGGFNSLAPASINAGAKADSYRTPVLYIGNNKPVEGDDIGFTGDFYYSRNEEKLYYRLLDVSNGKIKWQSL